MSGYDVDAREAKITGEQQRLRSLTLQELTEDKGGLVAATSKAFGGVSIDAAQLPPAYGLMAKHASMFQPQLELTNFILQRGALASRERELAILRLAWCSGTPYLWGEHVRLGKTCNVTDAEIERVTKDLSAPGWSEHDRAILAAVDELLRDQMISDQSWETLARSWSDQQLIEFPMVVGQYLALAFSWNSFRLRLASYNKGLRQR
jgi:alkylhydroperoxidase family enzyme